MRAVYTHSVCLPPIRIWGGQEQEEGGEGGWLPWEVYGVLTAWVSLGNTRVSLFGFSILLILHVNDYCLNNVYSEPSILQAVHFDP